MLEGAEHHDRPVDAVRIAGRDGGEEPLEESGIGVERGLYGVELGGELRGEGAGRVAADVRESLGEGGARLDEHGAARAGERLEQDAGGARLALVGDAVDEGQGEGGPGRRAELGQAHRDGDVPARELDAVVGGAPLRDDAEAEGEGEREDGDGEGGEDAAGDGRARLRVEVRGHRGLAVGGRHARA